MIDGFEIEPVGNTDTGNPNTFQRNPSAAGLTTPNGGFTADNCVHRSCAAGSEGWCQDKRLGRIWEIASVVDFLVSDAASYVTCATIDVNCGLEPFSFAVRHSHQRDRRIHRSPAVQRPARNTVPGGCRPGLRIALNSNPVPSYPLPARV